MNIFSVNREIFSNNLKSLMKEKGITQEILAKKTNISQGSISRWITMANIPSASNAATLSIFFRVNQRWLLSGEGHREYSETDKRDQNKIRVIEPDRDKYMQMAREILESGEMGTIEALKANIAQFHEQLKDKARIRELEKVLNAIKKGKTTVPPG